MPINRSIDTLLDMNRTWASRVLDDDPEFFKRLADKQEPPFLFIGCSDSRVPPDRITETDPGTFFVKRNIANQVSREDVALGAVIEYAVGILEVEHIIVCGHTRCGGVDAALRGARLGEALDAWLDPLIALVERSKGELQGLEGTARVDRMAEINVLAQLENLSRLDAVRAVRDRGRDLKLHAWLYSLDGGFVRKLVTL